MIKVLPTVALVGRPNVGKSRLFNRLVGQRLSIVHDQAGVTRDIVSAPVVTPKGSYTLLDTGGLGLESPDAGQQVILDAVAEQVDFAIQAAQVVLLVVDVTAKMTQIESQMAQRLRRYGKSVIVVANKSDALAKADAPGAFYELGFQRNIIVSAEHGQGMDELGLCITELLGDALVLATDPALATPEPQRVRICFVGRPNVGKSSLGNALLKTDRLIVSPVPGTTRDAVAIDLDYVPRTPAGSQDGPPEPLRFRLIDTAGLKPKSKINTTLDYFSSHRTHQALERCDVALLVLDAREGLSQLDKQLVSEIVQLGKGIVVVVNKWDIAQAAFKADGLDGYSNIQDFQAAFTQALRKALYDLPQAPILFTSATEGYALNALMRAANEVYQSGSTQLSTGVLNRQVQHLIDRNPPANKQGKRFKVYYSLQTETHPITLRLFCNQVTYLDAAYKRYLLSGLMELFKLKGCPLKLVFVGKPKPVAANTAGHNTNKSTRRRSSSQSTYQHKANKKGKK